MGLLLSTCLWLIRDPVSEANKRIRKEKTLDLLHSVSTFWANEYVCIRRLRDFFIQYSFTH